jgi:hypothetical protein
MSKKINVASLEIIKKALVKQSLSEQEQSEVDITQTVCRHLKENKRFGLVQNEVNYKILFPDFRVGDDPHASDSYRADLTAFTRDGFLLTEFKIYDEQKTRKGVWGVAHYLHRDISKLERAIDSNIDKHKGFVQFLFAVRNAKPRNDKQIATMKGFEKKPSGNEKRPNTSKGNFHSVLVLINEYLASSKPQWRTELVEKGNTAFLHGFRPLR